MHFFFLLDDDNNSNISHLFPVRMKGYNFSDSTGNMTTVK